MILSLVLCLLLPLPLLLLVMGFEPDQLGWQMELPPWSAKANSLSDPASPTPTLLPMSPKISRHVNNSHMELGACTAPRKCAHRTVSLFFWLLFAWVCGGLQHKAWSDFKSSCLLPQQLSKVTKIGASQEC